MRIEIPDWRLDRKSLLDHEFQEIGLAVADFLRTVGPGENAVLDSQIEKILRGIRSL
jgi:hypothetical protein